MSTTVTPVVPTPASSGVETQGQFRARMRATFGDGRNGTMHWRDNPLAQPEIAKRKAMKDQQWNAQLAVWRAQREGKKAQRTAEQNARIELAKQAGSVEEALRIVGVIQ